MKTRSVMLTFVFWGMVCLANAGDAPVDLDADSATLIVRGRITQATPVFVDLSTLMQLKSTSFEITNRWSGQKDRCKGVSLIYFLEFVGMDPGATLIEVIAANDYKTTIRIADLKQYEYILTYQLNGKLYRDLPPKQNIGPVAIAINFDKHKDLEWDIYKHQLVWFVKTIIVR